MKHLKLAVLCFALFSTVSYADECVEPEAVTLPNGATASMEDMLNGQKGVKTYQAANLEYMACLEKAFNAAEAEAKNGASDEVKKAAQARYDEAVDAYNAAVSNEEELASQFNTEIREYKAAQANK